MDGPTVVRSREGWGMAGMYFWQRKEHGRKSKEGRRRGAVYSMS